VKTTTIDGAYTIQTFTTDNNLESASGTWTVPAGVTEVEVLVVAGGGAGGGYADASGEYGGGGGGAGGLIYSASYSATPGATLNVQVGGGGIAVLDAVGGNGGGSIFAALTADGGGGGGARYSGAGQDGGSGGGGIYVVDYGPGYTTGQGSNGGAPMYRQVGGGGGGAGGAGGNQAQGGTGLEFSQFASWGDPANPGWFAGGGGGHAYWTNTGFNDGSKGGGGYGALWWSDYRAAGSGATGTGGGGGGGRTSNTNALSGNGGSGIVIVRYLTPWTPTQIMYYYRQMKNRSIL